MGQESDTYHREAYARSLDTIRVHNLTDEDFIIEDDKYGPQRQRVLVPAKEKDIGKGKGNNDLPRYLAERFVKKLIVQLINEKSLREWNKVKKNYRLEEQSKFEGRLALRTNDAGEWKVLFPQIWKGVITKYGGETLPEPVENQVLGSRDPLSRAMNETNLEDMEYHEEESNQAA